MSWLKDKAEKAKKYSPARGAFKEFKEVYNRATGKDLAKQTQKEQRVMKENINRQRQAEMLKAAEQQDEISRRRLLNYTGGMRNLYSTLGG